MTIAEPWQTSEIAGPKKALVVTKPEVVTELIRRTSRKLLIAGHRVAGRESNGYMPLNDIIRICKAEEIPIIATGIAAKSFRDLGSNVKQLSSLEIASRLNDPHWRGLDGNGPYSLALFTGLSYYVEMLMLSALKHYSHDIISINLDRYYQPNASWSFSNISADDWMRDMKTIVNTLEKE